MRAFRPFYRNEAKNCATHSNRYNTTLINNGSAFNHTIVVFPPHILLDRRAAKVNASDGETTNTETAQLANRKKLLNEKWVKIVSLPLRKRFKNQLKKCTSSKPHQKGPWASNSLLELTLLYDQIPYQRISSAKIVFGCTTPKQCTLLSFLGIM